MFSNERSYRVDEIALALAVSKRTVYRMVNDVEDPLPAVRLRGQGLRVEGRELLRYLERHKVRPEE